MPKWINKAITLCKLICKQNYESDRLVCGVVTPAHSIWSREEQMEWKFWTLATNLCTQRHLSKVQIWYKLDFDAGGNSDLHDYSNEI